MGKKTKRCRKVSLVRFVSLDQMDLQLISRSAV